MSAPFPPTAPPPVAARGDDSLSGVLYGVAAYGWWGFAAIYFKIVRSVPPLEILAHRVVWSLVILALLLTLLRRWSAIATLVRMRRPLAWLAASTILIAVNWFTFIWAVTHNQMLDASLGYFINPLVSVLLGYLFFAERLRRLERVSIAIAAAAVTWLTFTAGVFPWIAIVLAVSFGLYGLVRKKAGTSSIEGLTVETALLMPVSLGYLAFLGGRGELSFGGSIALDALLLAAGPVTALPLLWFASAVRRLRLATVGLLQYIAPTLQFALAVAVYDEPFGGERMIAFVLIWLAVALYTGDNLRTIGWRS